VTFHNYAGGAYASAGSIYNATAVLTVVSSSAALGADAVEEFDSGALSNTSVGNNDEIHLIAGNQTSFITITLEREVND